MTIANHGIGYTGEDALEEYIACHIEPEGELLEALYRDTNLRLLNPRMASGHIQGRLLKMLVSNIRPHIGHTILYCRLGLTLLLYTSCLQSPPYLRIRE